MVAWIKPPEPPLVREVVAPLCVAEKDLAALLGHLVEIGARPVEVNVARVSNDFDAVEALKPHLAFPSWCGSGWDSVEDAFRELADTWPFPFALVLNGFGELLARDPHAALRLHLRLSELEGAFSKHRKQMMVVLVASAWPSPPSP